LAQAVQAPHPAQLLELMETTPYFLEIPQPAAAVVGHSQVQAPPQRREAAALAAVVLVLLLALHPAVLELLGREILAARAQIQCLPAAVVGEEQPQRAAPKAERLAALAAREHRHLLQVHL
jgi:hypothetical protein